MIEIAEHDDVRRLRMWTRRSSAVGYDVSAYVVRGVLIDTGFRHVARELLAAVAELRPRGAVVTHWHEDHAGNAARLAASGLAMWLHPYTEQQLRERPQVKLYRHIVWGRPLALRGSVTPFDPAPLRVVPTPGHSPDHHVVFDSETRTLFSGDLWLGVKVRVMGASENPYQIIASLDAAIALRPERMFDAHRGLVLDPVAMLTAKRDWMHATIADIERLLDGGASEPEIVKQVLGGEERTAIVSEGEYSRRNFVRTVAKSRGDAGGGRP